MIRVPGFVDSSQGCEERVKDGDILGRSYAPCFLTSGRGMTKDTKDVVYKV